MNHKFVWLEMASDNLEASKKFYKELFGWDMNEAGAVTMVTVGAWPEMGASMKDNPGKGHIPSHWTPHVKVDDVKAATKNAEKLGAKILYDVHELPGGHGYASTLLDPAGAPISLWQEKK